jgi:hypothetical protein
MASHKVWMQKSCVSEFQLACRFTSASNVLTIASCNFLLIKQRCTYITDSAAPPERQLVQMYRQSTVPASVGLQNVTPKIQFHLDRQMLIFSFILPCVVEDLAVHRSAGEKTRRVSLKRIWGPDYDRASTALVQRAEGEQHDVSQLKNCT